MQFLGMKDIPDVKMSFDVPLDDMTNLVEGDSIVVEFEGMFFKVVRDRDTEKRKADARALVRGEKPKEEKAVVPQAPRPPGIPMPNTSEPVSPPPGMTVKDMRPRKEGDEDGARKKAENNLPLHERMMLYCVNMMRSEGVVWASDVREHFGKHGVGKQQLYNGCNRAMDELIEEGGYIRVHDGGKKGIQIKEGF